jgi:hypothetical protein
MLEFTFGSPTRLSLVEANQTVRAAIDRRAAARKPPCPPPPYKRRRHDGMHSGKPVPTEW